jgi:hypothetical protein
MALASAIQGKNRTVKSPFPELLETVSISSARLTASICGYRTTHRFNFSKTPKCQMLLHWSALRGSPTRLNLPDSENDGGQDLAPGQNDQDPKSLSISCPPTPAGAGECGLGTVLMRRSLSMAPLRYI